MKDYKRIDNVGIKHRLTTTISIPVKQNICDTHNVYVTSYLEWLDWADKKNKNGEKQTQCPMCGRWLFDCENTPNPVADSSTDAP